jgi:hypothetical protein
MPGGCLTKILLIAPLLLAVGFGAPGTTDETATFYVIKFGKGDMPPEGARVKTDELWDLVNYVRSFAKKNPSPTNPW